MDKNTAIQLLNPAKSKWFFLKQLPGAYFFGLKIEELNEVKSVVSVPYRWSTKNPFGSIYFAALTAAAELSTGAAAMAASGGKMSMLVTGMEGNFTKKGKSKVKFTCNQVQELVNTVQYAESHEEGATIRVNSVGHMEDGVEVARFSFQWSFKKKK